MLLYHDLFRSLLSYGITVWGLTYPSLTEKYILPKKVVRVITFNSKIAFSTPIFDKLQVLKQEYILQLQLSSFVYKCISNISPVHFQTYFNKILNIHQISTRQAVRGDLFVEHRSTIQYGKHFVQYLGARIWNDLPLFNKKFTWYDKLKKPLRFTFSQQKNNSTHNPCTLYLITVLLQRNPGIVKAN